ncbi:MAG TPA: KGG domain-containing protein [Thermoanaerobaculia bacterium]|nr:KGG domain-containing protein [Thermoanaerobaculia bacterium]
MANTSKRGFASMDPAKQREIASKGGRAAHAKGTAHEFTSDEARVAGRKGGEAVSRDRAHMSAIGREGGHSRGARARAATQTNDSSRSSFETGGRPITSASDRGTISERSERNERSDQRRDTATNDNRYQSRDEI